MERVSEVLQKQKKIEAKEVAELSQHAIKLHKQTDQWLALVHQFNGALKVVFYLYLAVSAAAETYPKWFGRS